MEFEQQAGFVSERFRPAPHERLLHWAFIALALVVSFELVRRAIPNYLPRNWEGAHEFDAIEDWKAARLYFQGISPFSAQGLAVIGQSTMGHPPTAPFWFLPVAEFPKATVVQLCTFMVWVLLPIHTFLCASTLKFPAPYATALFAASALFASSFVRYHCDATQLSEPIAVLYVAAWCSLRRGHELRAGACLGLALTMKLFPGVMLVMLLFAKRFRALSAAVVSYLSIALFMTKTYGLRSWYDFFHQQSDISQLWLGSNANSSISGLTLQLMKPACVGPAQPTPLSTLTTVACSLLLLAAALRFSWRHFELAAERDERDASAIDLPFSLFSLLSVFLNAWVWEHYAVLAIQPLFVLVAFFGRAWLAALRKWCEEQLTTKQLARAAAVLLLAAAGIGLTLHALSADSHKRGDLLSLWQTHHVPSYHRAFHWLQVENFVVWVVPISLCFLALRLSRPKPAIDAQS
ncbi:MAG TPA: glycosyltransferase family 87 protein [Polyangiaceae bacterium]|nr:glycosyltransferase family 87 protein [Polyangiaceae bacterium]